MRIQNFKPKEWTEKLYDFIQYLFEEEDDESVLDEKTDTDVQKLPTSEPEVKPESSRHWIWNILGFLDLVNCIILLLPILGYTSSHWTIYHVQNTRELQQSIIGTALGILMVLCLLFIAFPKIMRALLLGILIIFGTLPLISDKNDYASLWETYRQHVSSVRVQLDNELQGHVFYADEISNKMKKMVLKNVEHRNIRSYLLEYSSFDSDKDKGKKGEADYRSCIDLFQKVYDSWTYQADPNNRDLHRSPHKTILSFTGDCDDYTMLVASLFISQGYRIRIIMTKGHVYPELAIPDENTYTTSMKPLIKTLQSYINYGTPPLCFHKDNEGTIWLNMDYTAPYPGGFFMDERVLKVIYLD